MTTQASHHAVIQVVLCVQPRKGKTRFQLNLSKFAPSRPSRSAIARPMPRDEPVTIATFSERDTIIHRLNF